MKSGTTIPLDERFWSKVDRREPEQCWEWKAGKNKTGYGLFWIDGKQQKAHRASYQLHHGPIPDGLHVLHSCDNPSCVNPAHLHLGTQADNMREKMERGRSPSGEAHGRAKLISKQVDQIRSSYASGGVTKKQLADRFEVSRRQISDIVNGKSWKCH